MNAAPADAGTPAGGARATGAAGGNAAHWDVADEGAGTLAELYAASYGRLVGLLTVVCGSRPDAEEVVQEAFARLLSSWDRVSRYDDPEAWLRTVAIRLATSRWRRARVAARGVLRLGAPPEVPPPDGARLDAERILAALPRAQREVLVLHHGLGLPVAEIARELGVPTGTVKSRLARARAAAAAVGEDHRD